MPSYSLANWDGHLSQQNQQNQVNPSTTKPLSFGPPIRLLNPPKPKSVQGDVQPGIHADDGVNQRVGVGGGGGLSLGVSSTKHVLLSRLEGTSNARVFTRDALYHDPIDQEFQNLTRPVKEGRNIDLDLRQYPESMYSADADAESETGAIIIAQVGTSPGPSAEVFRDQAPSPGRSALSSSTTNSRGHEDYSVYLSPHDSPFNDASSQFDESMLFTPPPQGPSARSLFTPSPSPAPKRRQLVAYVEIPSFPKGLTRRDYIPMVRKRKRAPVDVQIHQSVGGALQASLSHNANVGVPRRIGKPVKVKSKPPPVTSFTSPRPNAPEQPLQHISEDPIMGSRFMVGSIVVNAVAGPSSSPLPGIHAFRHQGSHANILRKHKRADDDDFAGSKPLQKKLKSTKPNAGGLSGQVTDERARIRGTRRYTNYKRDTDHLRIFIDQISPVLPAIHMHNTRFIRAQSRNEKDRSSQNLHSRGAIKNISNYSGRSWFPWPPPQLGYYDQLQDDISLGGHWNIWESEARDKVGSHVIDEPHVLQPPLPAVHVDPPPRNIVTEVLPVTTPERPLSALPLTSPLLSLKEPIHNPRQPGSSVPESDPGSSESSFPTNDSFRETSKHSPRPSAKALGKRRAASEVPEPQTELLPLSPSQSPSPSPSLPSPPALLDDHLPPDTQGNSENEMAPYLHSLGSTHSQFNSHLIQTSPISFQSPERPLRGPNALLSPSFSPSQLYNPSKEYSSMDHNVFSEQRSPPPLLGFPMLSGYDPGVMASWAISGSSASNTPDPIDGYGNGTIDPSLLGGGLFAEDEPNAPSPPPASPFLHQNFNDAPHSPPHSPFHQDSPLGLQSPSVSLSHSSYDPSRNSRFPSRSVSLSQSSTSDFSQNNPTSRLSQIFSRPRRDARRRHPDMTAIEDLDLSLSDWSGEGTSTKKKRPATKKAQEPAKAGRGRTRAKESWPLDEQDSYCHQCRNKTFIMKIVCEECTKKYCARCLTLRYGERPESYDPLADFECPFCSDACTCDVCTRKRGDTYTGIGRGGLSAPRGPRTSPIPRTRHHPPQTDVPLEPITVSGPHTYWAAIYDLTGQKIGTAFVGGDGKEDVVMVQRHKSVPRRRVFVGAVQPSWSLGESPIIKDLDPVFTNNLEPGGRRLREYVGNRAILYFPVVPSTQADPADVEGSGMIEGHMASYGDGANEVPIISISDVDRGVFSSPLSSLSSLDESGDEGGEGECRKRPVVHESDFGIVVQGGLDQLLERGPHAGFSPDSLEDIDVVRAITLALRACGVAVKI